MEKKPTKREIKTQQTKEAIISAALKLFRRYGFERTSIQDICQEAGVSVGSLYHLFESKHAIIAYIMKDVEGYYDLTQTFDYGTVDPQEIFRICAQNFSRMLETLTPEVVFKALFSSPDGNKTIFYHERSNIVWLRTHLEGLKKAGRLPDDTDIESMQMMLNSASIGLFYQAYTLERLDHLEDEITELYTKLYRASV